jgi:hypothetical protein
MVSHHVLAGTVIPNNRLVEAVKTTAATAVSQNSESVPPVPHVEEH